MVLGFLVCEVEWLLEGEVDGKLAGCSPSLWYLGGGREGGGGGEDWKPSMLTPSQPAASPHPVISFLT